jgi:hypothetical protein
MYVIKEEFHQFESIKNFKNRTIFLSESSYSVSDPAPKSKKIPDPIGDPNPDIFLF